MPKQIRVEMELLNKQYLEQLKKTTKATSALTSQMSKDYNKMGKNALTAGKIIGGVLAAGFAALSVKAIKSAAAMEQQEIALTTMLGSAKRAKKVIKELEDLGASTPFETSELIASGKALISYGFEAEKVTDILKTVGDVAAGVSQPIGDIASIFGKARLAQNLYAEDLNQLHDRGIPAARELAKVLGVEETQIKKLASEGKVSFEALQAAFQNMTSEGGAFNNMMEKQSKSLSGMFSTVVSQVDIAAKAIGNDMMPALKVLISSFGVTMESGGALSAMFGALGKIGAATAELIGKAFIGVSFVINKIRKAHHKSQVDSLKSQKKYLLDSNNLAANAPKSELKRAGILEKVMKLQSEIRSRTQDIGDITENTAKLTSKLAEFDATKKKTTKEINEALAKNNKLRILGLKETIKKTKDLKTAQELYNEELKKAVGAFTTITGQIGNLAGQLDSALNGLAENEKMRIDATYDKRKAAIENSTLSEEEKASKLAAIEKKREKTKRKADRDEAIRAKTFGIIEATIATAAAVAKALPNWPLAIASGIFGLAQVAVIAAQPIPSLDTGTMDVPSDTLANIHQGEIVIPKSFSDAIRAGEASLGGGGGGGDIIVQGSIVDTQGLMNAVDEGRSKRAFSMGVSNYGNTGVYK